LSAWISLVVTVSATNEIQALKLNIDTSKPLFDQIREEKKARIQETAVSFEALLPGGPYDLWRSGEASRRVKDLVGAFAQFPQLPKMLNRQAILDTILQGCREGQFVLRLMRPDRSFRTFWRQTPSDEDLKNPALEVVLPEHAGLSQIDPSLLAPKVLQGLWPGDEIIVGDLKAYFSGSRVVKLPREGYEEPIAIPKADTQVVEQAVYDAVKSGTLWLTSGPTSILAEDIPTGLLTDQATLQAPPQPVPATDVQLDRLAKAWTDGTTTAHAIGDTLSDKFQKNLPWITVRNAIDAAIHARLLERAPDSGPWPCDVSGASQVKLVVPGERPPPPPPPPPPPGVQVATAYLKPNQIQDLADQIGEIGTTAVGHDLKIQVRIEIGGKTPIPKDLLTKINGLLDDVSKELKFET